MGEILVIGGASLDVLHLSGQIVTAAGGAAWYTAAAATPFAVQRWAAWLATFPP